MTADWKVDFKGRIKGKDPSCVAPDRTSPAIILS